ncbi:hypothetical protein M9H77_02086 [Catharanthus roseus]|uniref:Uncharacterized protein n=1 Tax=Catharanthus roseus TaxID=4058 RepID=A0ACC0C7I6_CATRO|nr:hypothetical protein M9H77_02086 [Catharanthus roseus]
MNGARRHTRRGGRWHSRTSCRGVVAKVPASTPAGLAGEDGRGLRTVRTVCPTTSTERPVGQILGAEGNAECLHIETGLPISTDEQLMFETASGSNKGHIYGFRSQSAAVTMPGGSNRLQGLYREGEEVVGIHAVYTGEVRRLHHIIHISEWSTAGFGTHSLPSFSPPDDNVTSQPPTGPPSSSPPLPLPTST